MKVSLAPATLTTLDRHDCDLLVLGCYREDRPIRGVGGLLDWRLDGWFSRLMKRGFFGGELGEVLLFPVGHRVAASRVLMVGMGSAELMDEARLGEILEIAWSNLVRLRAGRVAVPLLGTRRGGVQKRRAMTLTVQGAAQGLSELGRDLDLTVLVDQEDMKLLYNTLERSRTTSMHGVGD